MADEASFYIIEDGDIELNAGRRTVALAVANTGDRPVQVGSHAHFFDVNAALRFDRRLAFGMRLDIASGTAVRFEPGDTKPVTLVAYGGAGRPAAMSLRTEEEHNGPTPPEVSLAEAVDQGSALLSEGSR